MKFIPASHVHVFWQTAARPSRPSLFAMSLKRKMDVKEITDPSQKKAKSDFFAPKTAAVNTGLSFNFGAKSAEATRLTTWNVNGINSLLKDEKKRKVNESI